MKLVLPWPPGVNDMYTNRRDQMGRPGRQISEKYSAWKKAAEAVLWTTKVERFAGPVTVTLTLRDSGRYDPDNKLKPVLDFLVTHNIITTDDRSIVRRATAQTGTVETCEVEILSA